MITIEPIHVAIVAGVALVSGALTFVGILFTLRARVPRLADQVRSARYVFEYDDALQWLGVPGSTRRQLYEELRANIAAAAADAPVREVLRRMGPPRALARDVAAGPSRPRWIAGIMAGLIAATVGAWAVIAAGDVFASGQLGGVVESGQTYGATQTTPLLPGVEFSSEVAVDARGLAELTSFGVELSTTALAAPVLVGLLFARPWRAITSRRAQRAADH